MINTLRNNRTLREMLIGIIASGIIVALLCAALAKNVLFDITGLGVGIVGAIFMAIHIACTLEDAVTLDEKGAISHMRKMTYIRYGVICVLVILVGVFKVGSPVMCVIGVMLLKAGAYLQPVTHRILFGKEDLDVPDFIGTDNTIDNN